jgi:hypothetical protein
MILKIFFAPKNGEKSGDFATQILLFYAKKIRLENYISL